MLVAGVDVGNSTTEVAVARVEPGREPEWLLVLRRPTTGAEGIGRLRGGRRRPARAVPSGGSASARTCCCSPSFILSRSSLGGAGTARGARPRRGPRSRDRRARRPPAAGSASAVCAALAELAGSPDAARRRRGGLGEDFEHAAAALREARGPRLDDRGGRSCRQDDAVLIGNRFDRAHADRRRGRGRAGLPLGARRRSRCAAPAARRSSSLDPLRLAVLLGLSGRPRHAQHDTRHAPSRVTVRRSSCRGEARESAARAGTAAPVTLVDANGNGAAARRARRRLRRRGRVRGAPGSRRRPRRPARYLCVPLPAPPDDAGLRPAARAPARRRRRAARRRRAG